jgi:hypothetical protein
LNFKKTFYVNEEKSIDGVWFPYEDAEFLVARSRSRKYRAEIERLSRKYRRQIELGTLSREKNEEIVTRAMANAILNGWKGSVALDDDGTQLPYSRENAFLLLTEFPDFRELVSSWSQDIEAYQTDEKESDIKNLEVSSPGF